MKEKKNLMNERKIKELIINLEKKFSKVYTQQDYSSFKKNADKFFDFYRDLQPEVRNIPKDGFQTYFAEELKARIFLGIGCELLLKAVYLKEGYSINQIKITNPNKWRKRLARLFSREKGPSKPHKLSEVSERQIIPSRTFGMSYYLKYFHIFFPDASHNEYLTYVHKGLEIAKIWRDKEAHIGGGYHYQTGTDLIDISNSLAVIYSYIFKERFKPFVPSQKIIFGNVKIVIKKENSN